jgi:DNA polymerase III epsilon subunit-like protein
MIQNTYSRHHPGSRGLCIDWETTGADFDSGESHKRYQGISFGAVIYNTETFESVETLYREIKFDGTKYQWTDGAEKIHGLSREYLAENGIDRSEALADLLDLIERHIGATNKIQICGHNVGFDRNFTDALCNDFGVQLEWHHVQIETSQLAFVAIGKYKSNDVFPFFCGETRTLHNALDDAEQCLSVVRGVRAMCNQALGIV